MITTDVFTERIELHAYGRLTINECREFEHLSDYRIKFNGPLDLLLDLRELESCSLDALIEQIRYGRRHAHDFSRIAVISDNSMVTWMAMCSQIVVNADVRVFDEEGMAREWLGVSSADTSDQQTAH